MDDILLNKFYYCHNYHFLPLKQGFMCAEHAQLPARGHMLLVECLYKWPKFEVSRNPKAHKLMETLLEKRFFGRPTTQ